MRKFDEYIMVAPGSDYATVMWNDLRNVPECTYHDFVLADNSSSILKKLHHLHFSFSLNRFFDIPLQCIWRSAYTIKPDQLSDDKKYCIIFTDISACRVDKGFLKKLQEKPNVTLVMVIVNIVAAKERILKQRFNYFTDIFSFDKGDCDKYGFYHYTTYYSKLPLDANVKKESDAFFVGVSKGGRHTKLVRLFRRMQENGAKADFYIAHHREKTDREKGIHYNEWLNYDDVLQKVLNTNCIVEIVGENQQGFTLRAIEAICYNKRLLTDNAVVKESKYYDTGFILYTPNIEDADISFITDTTPVEYNYCYEYSPVRFLDYIDEVVTK